MTNSRPLLPKELWRVALPTIGEAWQVQQELSQNYVTALGINRAGWFVASPGSGLSEKLHMCEEPPVKVFVLPEELAEWYDMAA